MGKNTFLISWIFGTVILLGFLMTQSVFFAWMGFYYVIAACIFNLIVFFSELLIFVTDVTDKKSHGNSALLILFNIPVALLYLFIFIQL